MNVQFTAEMARRVAEDVRAIDPDDEDFLADALEGETDFPALLGRLAEADAEADMMIGALKHRKAELDARKGRWERRKDAARRGIQTLLDAVQARKWTLPEATVSLSERESVKAQDDADPELLPDDLVKVERKPVMAAVRHAIAAGRNVPGYAVERVRSVTVRRK